MPPTPGARPRRFFRTAFRWVVTRGRLDALPWVGFLEVPPAPLWRLPRPPPTHPQETRHGIIGSGPAHFPSSLEGVNAFKSLTACKANCPSARLTKKPAGCLMACAWAFFPQQSWRFCIPAPTESLDEGVRKPSCPDQPRPKKRPPNPRPPGLAACRHAPPARTIVDLGSEWTRNQPLELDIRPFERLPLASGNSVWSPPIDQGERADSPMMRRVSSHSFPRGPSFCCRDFWRNVEKKKPW